MTEKKRTLLLVEDELVNAISDMYSLRRAGYEVIHVSTGKAAIEMVGNVPGKIDMVLMDVNLGSPPDGAQTARQILQDRSLPIVFRSSYDDEEFVARTEAITAYGYVSKQAGVAVLLAAIKMAFRLHDTRKYLEQRTRQLEVRNDDLREMNDNLEAAQAGILNREEQLWQSERRFRAITEHLPVGIFIASENRFAYVNPAAAEFFGASGPEQLFGTEIGKRIHPDFMSAVAERIRKLKNKESVKDVFDHMWIRLDGSLTWGETVGEPIEYAGKDASVVVIRDTNYRRNRKEQSHPWKELCAEVCRQTGTLLAVLDRNQQLCYVSAPFQSLLEHAEGYDPKEPSGSMEAMLAEASTEYYDSVVYRRLATPKNRSCKELRLSDDHGDVKLTFFPWKGPSGTVEGVLVFAAN